MNLSIIGTGYVGLVTGTCFAETGVNVNCVDIDKTKIENLKQGILPIWEPGLKPLVDRNIKNKRLSFTTDIKETLENCDLVFSAVGTPPGKDGSADLQQVLSVAKEVGQHMQDYLVFVTKSTVPIGTAKKIKKVIQDELDKRNVDIKFDVASNPEFLKEGSAVNDFMKPDRIVVGVESQKAEKIMKRLYKPFLLNGHPVIFMDIPSAEMTKYTANSILATKISFMNEIANLCEIVGADITKVRKGIGSDKRIGYHFIYAGTGYGGSCFPKDVKALIKTADDNNYSLSILKAVESVNEKQKNVLIPKIQKYFKNNLEGKKIAVWGLAFKPNTDDMREAPSIVITKRLTELGAKVYAYDPVAMEEAKKQIGDIIEYTNDLNEALIDADALVVVTEWNEFKTLNYKVIGKLMKNKVIFDGRNIYDPAELKENDFEYFGIGR